MCFSGVSTTFYVTIIPDNSNFLMVWKLVHDFDFDNLNEGKVKTFFDQLYKSAARQGRTRIDDSPYLVIDTRHIDVGSGGGGGGVFFSL